MTHTRPVSNPDRSARSAIRARTGRVHAIPTPPLTSFVEQPAVTNNHLSDAQQMLLAADAAVTGDHLCPGCGRHVRHGHVGCWRCWTAIPEDLREPLRPAFRRRQTDPLGFARAVHEAIRLITLYSPHRKDSP